MRVRWIIAGLAWAGAGFSGAVVHARTVPTSEPVVSLPAFTVTQGWAANEETLVGFPQTVSRLRYEPSIDIQSRGAAEGQADISIRAGVFENTSVVLGAVPLYDPQTGHYFAEVPIDPEMLGGPEVLTGVGSALGGFNASVGTVRQGWAPLEAGGSARVGVGTDALHLYALRQAWLAPAAEGADTRWGVEGSAAYAASDGTVDFGETESTRFAGRIQRRSSGAQSDLFVGYLDEAIAWPGMYTGRASLHETDQYEVFLAGANHRQTWGDEGFIEVGVAYRTLLDDYDFSRETPDTATTLFEHETQALTAGLVGAWPLRENFRLRFGAQGGADELSQSTNLTAPGFASRSYGEVSLLPEATIALADNQRLTVAAGGTWEASNRDGADLGPLARVAWTREATDRWEVYVEGSSTSQVSGYTALKSPRGAGLFRGNPDLDRQRAANVELGARWERGDWLARAAVFLREEDDLTDWTYGETASGSGVPQPFRAANAVDIDTKGLELGLEWRGSNYRLGAAYTHFEKDAAYEAVGAGTLGSYYALNYPEDRIVLAAVYTPWAPVDLRLDVEMRRQAENPLRTSSDEATVASAAVGWRIEALDDLRLIAAVDNLSDSQFQDYPGTPAPGRQFSLQAHYAW